MRFRFKSDGGANADGFYFDDLKVTVINPLPLGNQKFNLDNVFISPNPAVDYIIINNFNRLENYKIFNISGQLLASEKINLDKIDINNLSNGVYFLELSNLEQKKIFKFIVQK